MLNLHASEKNRFIHFPEDVQKNCWMFRKTAVLKVLGNPWKSVFSRVPFRQFKISNLPSMNILKTVSSANVSCEFS